MSVLYVTLAAFWHLMRSYRWRDHFYYMTTWSCCKNERLRLIECKLELVVSTLNIVLLNQEKIMAGNIVIMEAAVALQASVDTMQEAVRVKLLELSTSIAALQALVDQGGTVEERQAIVDALVATTADIESTLV